MDTHVNRDEYEEGRSTQSSILRFQFNELTKSQQVLLGKVDKMSDRLLDPDTGVVVKIKSLDDRSSESTAKITTLTTNLEKLTSICTKYDERVGELEQLYEISSTQTAEGISKLNENFDAISSTLVKLNSDFESRRTARKRTDRLIGLIVVAILACLVPAIKSMFGEQLDEIDVIMPDKQDDPAGVTPQQDHHEPSTR